MNIQNLTSLWGVFGSFQRLIKAPRNPLLDELAALRAFVHVASAVSAKEGLTTALWEGDEDDAPEIVVMRHDRAKRISYYFDPDKCVIRRDVNMSTQGGSIVVIDRPYPLAVADDLKWLLAEEDGQEPC